MKLAGIVALLLGLLAGTLLIAHYGVAAVGESLLTIGWTGYQPYRVSQMSSLDNWLKAGFTKEAAENYLGAINGALNNPNMASDMKIPGAQQYTGVVLDTELARYLAGEITVDEALANIEAGWEEITEDFGRDAQIKAQGLALRIRKDDDDSFVEPDGSWCLVLPEDDQACLTLYAEASDAVAAGRLLDRWQAVVETAP